jgi:hypothetical protein
MCIAASMSVDDTDMLLFVPTLAGTHTTHTTHTAGTTSATGEGIGDKITRKAGEVGHLLEGSVGCICRLQQTRADCATCHSAPFEQLHTMLSTHAFLMPAGVAGRQGGDSWHPGAPRHAPHCRHRWYRAGRRHRHGRWHGSTHRRLQHHWHGLRVFWDGTHNHGRYLRGAHGPEDLAQGWGGERALSHDACLSINPQQSLTIIWR